MAGELSGGLGSLGRLLAVIGLDTGPLAAGVLKAQGEFAKLEGAAESSFAKLGGTAQLGIAAAVVAVGTLGVKSVEAANDLETANARLATAIADAGGSFGDYESQISDVDTRMEGFGFTNTQVADSLSRLTIATQDPIKAMQEMGLVADIARGLNMDLSSATLFLAKVLEGNYKALTRQGLASKEQVAAFKNTGDAVAFLEQKLGGQASAYAETLDGKMDHLKATMEDTAAGIGEHMIPVLSTLVDSINEVIGGFNDLTGGSASLGDILGGALAEFSTFGISGIVDATSALFDEGDAAKQSAQSIKENTEAQKAANKAANDLAKSILELPRAEQSAESAHQTLSDAQAKLNDLLEKGAVDAKAVASAENQVETAAHSLESAHQSTADAVDRLNQLLEKGPVDAKAVETAQRSLESTSRSLASAQDKVAQAQQHLNDVMKGASAEDLGKGELSLEQASLGLAQAKQAEADAQERLVAAYKSGDPNKVADANLALQSAHLGVRTAEYQLQDAQKRLNDLQNQGKEGSKDLADAQKGLRDAQQAASDAARAQADAQNALNVAMAGDPDYARKVEAAERQVESARWGEHQATLALTTANENLRTAQRGDPDFNDKVAKAQDAVAKATLGAAEADVNLQLAHDAAKGSTDDYRDHLQFLIDKYNAMAEALGPDSELGKRLRDRAAEMEALSKKTDELNPKIVGELPGGGLMVEVPGHAGGGDMSPGEWSWLGEKGPELGHLLPGGVLQVFPADKSAAMASDAFHKMTQVSAAVKGGGGDFSQMGRSGNPVNEGPTQNINRHLTVAVPYDMNEISAEVIRRVRYAVSVGDL